MGKCSCPNDCQNIHCLNKDNTKNASKKQSSKKGADKKGSDKNISKKNSSSKNNSATQIEGIPLKCMDCPNDCDEECARIRNALNSSCLENCIRDLINRILVCLRALFCVPMDELQPRGKELAREASVIGSKDSQTKNKEKKNKKRVATALFTNKLVLKRNSRSSPNIRKLHRGSDNKFFSNKIKKIRSLYHLPKHRMVELYNKLFCENLEEQIATEPCVAELCLPQNCIGCRCGCAD